MIYRRRLVDDQLDALLPELAAVAIEGARGVGKTETARRRAATVVELDNGEQLEIARADPQGLIAKRRPLLLDEWQLLPDVWNLVRRAVDRDRTGGQFLLTGSSRPVTDARVHSGAGRIVRLLLRPLALCERGVVEPTVSLGSLLEGGRPRVAGESGFLLADYVREIATSGLPGLRSLDSRARSLELRSYLDRAVDHELVEVGQRVRRPQALRSWLAAYAAATATTTSYNKILEAATPGEPDRPARQTVAGYRDALERMWLLDPLPAWLPAFTPLKRLAQAPKHHLVDPALAAVLLNVSEDSLLQGGGRLVGRHATLLGALFESLATLTVRAIAAAREMDTYHFRDRDGSREIDLIVERPDHDVLAIEVKLAATVTDADVRHLAWLRDRLGERVVDAMVLSTGRAAYRRQDGIAVVPLALLGA